MCLVRLMGMRSDLSRLSLHVDVHETPVPMQEGDLVKEIVSRSAELCCQRLGFALRAGELERRKRLEQMERLDQFARLRRVETGGLHHGARLDFGGFGRWASHKAAADPSGVSRRAQEGAQSPGATKHGERGHDGKAFGSKCWRPCS